MRVTRTLAVPLGFGLLACVFACRPDPGTSVDPDTAEGGTDVDEPGPAIIPDEPANKGEGDPLVATIPLATGETLELESLRGRPVLLEISASWEVGWDEAHAFYAELAAAHPELAVIVVAAEVEDRALLELPEGLARGWDPAGALAAKLTVATFPTMFVLDRDGRITRVVNGWDESVQAELSDAVTALAPGG